MTPANARRVTSELAKMRGAAMKLGQVLSMDAGDVIPKELADILAQLRADAHIMPKGQLETQLAVNFGWQWHNKFAEFEMRPIAAASIGQVHRATTHDGETLALKIQYPGIRDSIDSDVKNLAGLLNVTGLLPKSIELEPLLDEISRQLHNEANYELEAEHLTTFGNLLADDERFIVPALFKEYTSDSVLAMAYVEGSPIEEILHASQDIRNEVMRTLFELTMKELFELHLMQTDPNFANYLYQPDSGKIVLLDFGATRDFSEDFSTGYKQLVEALLARDDAAILHAARIIGYQSDDMSPGYQHLLLTIFRMIADIFDSTSPYDFKNAELWTKTDELNAEFLKHKDEWQAPPTDALFFHRKLGGLFMLASRIDARVAMRPLLEPWL